MKLFLSLFLSLLGQLITAQDLSGVWTGNYEKLFLVPNPRQLVVELNLHNDSLLTGASHLYYRDNKFEHYAVRGKYNFKDSTVYFREDSVLAVRLGLMASNCAGNYSMKLRVTDSSYILEGRWRDNAKGIFKCPATRVWLEKKYTKDRVIPRKADASTTRATDIQSLVEYTVADKDSIRVDLYDNAEIDNDTVSVYFNDQLILKKVRITDRPITFYVSMNTEIKFNKLLLFAESLGEIPPCTALMIITTGKKRYEVNLSSNFSKNAALEFFLKE